MNIDYKLSYIAGVDWAQMKERLIGYDFDNGTTRDQLREHYACSRMLKHAARWPAAVKSKEDWRRGSAFLSAIGRRGRSRAQQYGHPLQAI